MEHAFRYRFGGRWIDLSISEVLGSRVVCVTDMHSRKILGLHVVPARTSTSTILHDSIRRVA